LRMLQAVTSPSTLLIFLTCTHTDDCGFGCGSVTRSGSMFDAVSMGEGPISAHRCVPLGGTKMNEQAFMESCTAAENRRKGRTKSALSVCLLTGSTTQDRLGCHSAVPAYKQPREDTQDKTKRSCKQHMCNSQVRWHTRGKDRLPAHKGQQPSGSPTPRSATAHGDSCGHN
jgi:hypothetical protein